MYPIVLTPLKTKVILYVAEKYCKKKLYSTLHISAPAQNDVFIDHLGSGPVRGGGSWQLRQRGSHAAAVPGQQLEVGEDEAGGAGVAAQDQGVGGGGGIRT